MELVDMRGALPWGPTKQELIMKNNTRVAFKVSTMNKQNILKLYPEFDKVYGPYIRKDGRQHVVLKCSGKSTSVSWPKLIMELELNRRLGEDETVDHMDRDFSNNNIENLQILSRTTHGKIDAIYRKEVTVRCPMCDIEFVPTRGQISNSQRLRQRAGPFCSRQCAGKYGAMIQHGLLSEIGSNIPPAEYIRKEK